MKTSSRRAKRIHQHQHPSPPSSALAWLDSTDFARYALIPEEALPVWTGVEADDVIGEYVATVRKAGRDVLTLGGEPLPIAWIPQARVFARWYYAEDDSTLLSALEAAMDSDGWEDVLDIELGGRYVLTDAAYSGARIADHTSNPTEISELIRVELPSGRYRVQSLIIDPDPETQWMLERLLPE